MDIIPAILTNDPVEMDGWSRKVRDSKKFGRVQIDFIDGKFANNLTIKPSDCDLIPYLPLKFDAHLMVVEDNILNYSKTAEKMGFSRIIAQMESILHPEEFTALALDIHSPIEAIKPYLEKVRYVIVMSVEPGFGGQEFMDKAIEHARELKKLGVRVCVDGGIKKEHLRILEEVGVDEVAVGVNRVLSW